MAYLDHLLADPVYLALTMAALSLVVSLTTCLYIAATARGAGGTHSSRGRTVAASCSFDRGFSDSRPAAGRSLRQVSEGPAETEEESSAVLETRLHFSGNRGNDDKGQRFV